MYFNSLVYEVLKETVHMLSGIIKLHEQEEFRNRRLLFPFLEDDDPY